MRKRKAVIFAMPLIWSLCSYSAESTVQDPPLEKGSENSTWWENTHKVASTTIGEWANNIDSFLSGYSSTLPSDSYVNIRFGPIFDEDSASGFFDLKAKLKLPNTKNRLRLVVETGGDSLVSENELGEPSEEKDITTSVLSSKVSAAVRYMKKDIGADFDAGILVKFPLDPFVRLRFSQSSDEADWEWWQKQEVFAYYSEGVGARYRAGFNYRKDPTFNYSADFGTTWLDQDGLFYLRENFFIYHHLNKKNSLTYQVSFLQSGEDQDDISSESFLYNVLYERRLYKNWLIGQVKPQVTYEEENNYDADPSLTLSLSILLGPKYLH